MPNCPSKSSRRISFKKKVKPVEILMSNIIQLESNVSTQGFSSKGMKILTSFVIMKENNIRAMQHLPK